MTPISKTTDYLHCFCRFANSIFVLIGEQVITVAGEIKVDDTACKEAGKLLYRGTGGFPVPFLCLFMIHCRKPDYGNFIPAK